MVVKVQSNYGIAHHSYGYNGEQNGSYDYYDP